MSNNTTWSTAPLKTTYGEITLTLTCHGDDIDKVLKSLRALLKQSVVDVQPHKQSVVDIQPHKHQLGVWANHNDCLSAEQDFET